MAKSSSATVASKPIAKATDPTHAHKTPPNALIIPAIVCIIGIGVTILLTQSNIFSASSHDNSHTPSTSIESRTATLPDVWGTYRPNLYLGVRRSSEKSPLFGWLWSCAGSDGSVCSADQQINQLRHDAEERDGLTKYGWLQHDGETFGKQGLVDRKMGVNLTTTFLRSEDGESWVVRIEGQSTRGAKEETETSLYFYTGLSAEEHSLELDDLAGLPTDQIPADRQFRVHAGIPYDVNVRQTSPFHKGRRSGVINYTGMKIDLRPPSAALKKKQAANQAPPQQYTWAAKDLVKEALSEVYRKEWEIHSSKVQQLQREHDASQRGAKQKTQFHPPSMPDATWTLPNTIQSGANFFVMQVVLRTPFVVDYTLHPTADGPLREDSNKPDATEVPRTMNPSGSPFDHRPDPTIITQAFAEAQAKFQNRFDSVFPILANKSAAETEFAQALLSNMLGGIGYFHGRQLIETVPAKPAQGRNPAVPAVVKETRPSTLFSAVPSRSFFPRGFMWDEGFHELLISKWDMQLSLQILASWFAQIQLDSKPLGGWLPREQILGEESRRRVPEQFQAQKPWVANPPVLILALEKILQRLKAKEEADVRASGSVSEETQSDIRSFDSFLHTWLPTLHQHVQWFFFTQASSTPAVEVMSFTSPKIDGLPSSFRWQGRTKEHCLASGLDDYPRSLYLPTMQKDKVPNAAQQSKDAAARLDSLASQIGEEGHVDLHAWMLVLAKTMSGLTDYAQRREVKPTATETGATETEGQQGKQESKHDYALLSRTYASYATKLESTLYKLHWNSKSKSFADYVYRNGTRSFVPHIGYVSLLPMFLTVLPPSSPELLSILQQLRSDEWSLWTNAGLRSLSKKDKFFGSKEDYWRGHIWINMQYLAAQALTFYANAKDSPSEVRTLAAELSSELRKNVATNVGKEYRRTGYVWEQYNAIDGTGRKSHPFTGWTALTLLIMGEQ